VTWRHKWASEVDVRAGKCWVGFHAIRAGRTISFSGQKYKEYIVRRRAKYPVEGICLGKEMEEDGREKIDSVRADQR